MKDWILNASTCSSDNRSPIEFICTEEMDT